MRELLKVDIPLERLIYAGGIKNTKTEALAAYEAIVKANIRRKHILIITGRMHSRTANYVWKNKFPVSTIYTSYFSESYEFQKDHPLFLQRGPWCWLMARMLCHAMLRIEDFLGLDIVSKIQHPKWFSQ